MNPKFKQHFEIKVMQPDHVVLLTEGSHHLLVGRPYVHLAPLLDGRHSLRDIIKLLDGIVSPPEIYYLVEQAMAKGFLLDATKEADLPEAEAAFWHSLGTGTLAAQKGIAARSVSITRLGCATATHLIAALGTLKVRICDTDSDLLIVVTDDYLQTGLEEINARQLIRERPWALVKLTGSVAWVGPIFIPGLTGCWSCLAQRLRGNRQVETYLLRRRGRSTPLNTSLAALEPAIEMAANLAATEILKWASKGENENLAGNVITYDFKSNELKKHRLTKRPQCPMCGEVNYIARYLSEPIKLGPAPKRFTGDGGHRCLFPEETFTRYAHHISPVTGVVNSLFNRAEEMSELLYSYVAVHHFPMVHDDLNVLRDNLRGRSGGKGISKMQAKVSALGEAMERYCGVWQGDELTLRTSYRQLGTQAIHLNQCLHFSDRQFSERATWNRAVRVSHHLVPNPFEEDRAIDWTPVWSLNNHTCKYIPTAYCYFGHPEIKQFFCFADSNGCASGNTLEEAILQGFLELIERDGVALWWYNRVERPAVDVGSFDLDYFKQLEEFYHSINRELWVLDLTTDIGIPTFAAISAVTERKTEDMILGFGAHLDPRIGIMRALTELNQSLPSVTASYPDGRTKYTSNNPDALLWYQTATLASQPYLVPHASMPAKTRADYVNLSTDDLRSDVEVCLKAASDAGLETFALDQTRPDLGMRVCRIIVPGLRHFWRRLGPGRLYDVPVKLGWLQRSLTEDKLNPFSIFF